MNDFIVGTKIRRTTTKIRKQNVSEEWNKRVRKAVFFNISLLLLIQAHKKAAAEAVSPSKQPPAANVLTSTNLAQDPVRALQTSLTETHCSVLGSPLSEMSHYKLFNDEKAVIKERGVNPSLLKCMEEDCDTLGPWTAIYTDPAMVHVTLNHAFCCCRNKITKDHRNMGLDARVTANQHADQRPFGDPFAEERGVNPSLLKCMEEDCDTLRPLTAIYTDPAMVHVTLNHAFCGCRNKITKVHRNMRLDAWVTANQHADQRPFGDPFAEEQIKIPPRPPPTPQTALLNLLEIIWKQHRTVELHTDSGEWMLWFSSNPAPEGWNIPVPEGKQRG